LLVRPRTSASEFPRSGVAAAGSALWSQRRWTATLLAVAATALAASSSQPAFAASDQHARSSARPGRVAAPAAKSPKAVARSLDCTGSTIYAYQRGSSSKAAGALLGLATGTVGGPSVTASVVSPVPGGGFANALGVTRGGTAAYAVDQTSVQTGTVNVRRFNSATSTWTTYSGTAGTAGPGEQFVAGAVDQADNVYYYASFQAGTSTAPGIATVYGFNTLTNTAIPGTIATFDLPVAGSVGANGDLAFDMSGNMYILQSAGHSAALGIVPGPVPTTGSAHGATLIQTTLSTIPDPAGDQYNGVAFDNSGNMYIEYSTENTTYLERLDPSTGAVTAGPTPLSNNNQLSVDLGTCSANPTLTLQKNIVGRFASSAAANDQFGLSITGGGATSGNAAITTGTADGVQPAVAGPIIAATGTTYTLAETADSGSLADYHSTYSCVDTANRDAPVLSGSGTDFPLTFPATAADFNSPAVLCTFTNDPVAAVPGLKIVKTASPPKITAAGQSVAYGFVVTNTGNVTLTGVGVRETAFSGKGATPTVTCLARTATLAPAASEICSAAYTVTSSDLTSGKLTNTAIATGTPPTGPTVSSASSSAVVTLVPAGSPAPGRTAEPPVTTIPGGVEAGHPGSPGHGDLPLGLFGAVLSSGALTALLARRRRRR